MFLLRYPVKLSFIFFLSLRLLYLYSNINVSAVVVGAR